jgi:nucleotide-binding universal stress UspA family protein
MMYQTVLIPLDGSDLAECALPHVKKMAKEGFIKDICILTVIDIHPSALLEGADTTVIYQAQMNNSREYLDRVQSQFRAEGFEVKTEILKGSAAQVIAEYANQQKVELIVIATHGYSGVKRLMFGSVAFGVLHDSHVPVLLIRPDSFQVP